MAQKLVCKLQQEGMVFPISFVRQCRKAARRTRMSATHTHKRPERAVAAFTRIGKALEVSGKVS